MLSRVVRRSSREAERATGGFDFDPPGPTIGGGCPIPPGIMMEGVGDVGAGSVIGKG